MKRVLLLLSLFMCSTISSMQLAVRDAKKVQAIFNKHMDKLQDKTMIDTKSVSVPERLGSLKLQHSKDGFHVIKDNKKYEIQKCFVDKNMRNIDKKQLKMFLENGYFSINQMNDGKYSLKANGRLNGGGALGAAIGACVGKVGVSLLGHGAIYVVGLCTGPAMPATIIALEAAFGPAIELASIKGAIAGGIALGVATGPV